PDLVGRDFTAAAPNELWVTDLTFVPTWAGVARHPGLHRSLERGQPGPGDLGRGVRERRLQRADPYRRGRRSRPDPRAELGWWHPRRLRQQGCHHPSSARG